ncbi:Adenosylcobinamide amidohydrolase [Tritonibacter multivorans]|uniref:Adenosylcobinamide amidohydrolase n=1 Tax=Tritonibacter multivorans TaxID=928856 RepID=A0A0P1GF55_9RHOB|nr:adenosylcobinamide amidohydrolase [Tritonibacter multivorans]MDA7421113.1 adenosylcobinamide amidohydrolase [Tritonibacter multivorans]CUH80148.1 Adenosylcobinamide amidohydrolase [Tritonibacter multivorans]SFC74822.1 Adenosylcobinamide amidohydrolase [Tritonibacter multivorans]
MPRVTLQRPWIEFDLGQEMHVLSWAINRPGFVTTDRILWREVRNADLTPDLDVTDWLNAELATQKAQDAVAFLTSRDVRHHHEAQATVDGITAHVLATVGLSNAERIGSRMDYSDRHWGTINVAVALSEGVSQPALIEMLSIAVQARTVAVMDAGFDLPVGAATGTGTDCLAVAAPPGDLAYAGLHTAVGEAVGKATYDAVRQGADIWKQSNLHRHRKADHAET